MFKQRFSDDKEDDFNSDDEKIILDKSAFKALASDTRVSILKELDKRRKTLTELSETLNLAVATVKEHVEQLSKSGLVSMKDEGRKWKYYDLTEKGKAILYPERKKIWVLLVSFLFMLSLSFYMTYYDVGYIATGRMLASDGNTSGIASIAYDSEEANIESVGVYTDDSGEMGVMEDQGIMEYRLLNITEDGEYLDGDEYLYEDISEELINRDLDSEVQSVESFDVKASRNIPYLRYASYFVTLVSCFVLVLISVTHLERRKKQRYRKPKNIL